MPQSISPHYYNNFSNNNMYGHSPHPHPQEHVGNGDNVMGLHALWESVFLKMESEPVGGGVMSADEAMRQRGRVKEDKYCGVCGDRALGYNFDAISCESCKAFFRRNAPKGLEYFKCPYDENCKMDISNRRFCKRCRLRKCFEIGMRKEYILTEEEKSRKRQRIEENRKVKDDGSLNGEDGEPRRASERTLPLTFNENILIDEIVNSYKTSLELGSQEFSMNKDSINDLVNVCEVSIRRVIDMAKKITSFKSLPQSVQISLLKGGSIELLIIRSVLTFDRERQLFLDARDNPQTSTVTLDQLKSAAMKNGRRTDDMDVGSALETTGFADSTVVEDLLKFIKVLGVDMKADETMLILLLLISLFSPDRPNLEPKDLKDLVAKEQDRYATLLRRYVESKMPVSKARIYYAKLLMKLTDIRDLNEESSQVFLHMKPEGIQPLMKEVLDLQSSATTNKMEGGYGNSA